MFMRGGLLALMVTLQCTPLWADEVENAARDNATSAPQAEIPWMSGGIGSEARDSMRKAAGSYNVHLEFAARNGGYLASIPVTVTGHDGRQVYAGTSAGPFLYLKLPFGPYRIAAELDGTWQTRRIHASASGRATQVMFVSRED